MSWYERQNTIGVTHAEWGTHSDMTQGLTPCTWSYNPEMPLGRECPLPDIPSINHNQLSISSSPIIHASLTELDKQINDSTKFMEERAKQFLEEQSKQTEKLKEQNKKNELRNVLLRTKKLNMLREIAELKKQKNERDKKEQLCNKLDNTMDYCITRRGHKGEDIDSDWICIGTTYLLKKIDKCE